MFLRSSRLPISAHPAAAPAFRGARARLGRGFVKNLRVPLVVALTLGSILSSGPTGRAHAATLCVSQFAPPDTCYPTIQSAINDASDGDTILVDAGTYFENIFIGSGKICGPPVAPSPDACDVATPKSLTIV